MALPTNPKKDDGTGEGKDERAKTGCKKRACEDAKERCNVQGARGALSSPNYGKSKSFSASFKKTGMVHILPP